MSHEIECIDIYQSLLNVLSKIKEDESKKRQDLFY